MLNYWYKYALKKKKKKYEKRLFSTWATMELFSPPLKNTQLLIIEETDLLFYSKNDIVYL